MPIQSLNARRERIPVHRDGVGQEIEEREGLLLVQSRRALRCKRALIDRTLEIVVPSPSSKAMPDQNTNAQLAASDPPTSIALATGQTIDLSFIPEAQRNALMAEYMRGTLDVARKANELHVDVVTLRNTLGALADTTRQVSLDGNSVTVTHTQTTAVGRTEIIMGNTETAGKGKLTRSQTNSETNWTPYYIFAAIAAVVLIALAIASHWR
jgi:hypothetical protein